MQISFGKGLVGAKYSVGSPRPQNRCPRSFDGYKTHCYIWLICTLGPVGSTKLAMNEKDCTGYYECPLPTPGQGPFASLMSSVIRS